ncbi:MAG: serine hydrolase, partial [Oscillospiraceae bacterium]
AVDPQGLHPAGWGLFLKTRDMAKIGQLYLSSGMWNGAQIVPAQWVAESTRGHSRWGSLPYGYLWWVIDGKRHIYVAMGDGGNTIYVNAQKQLVVSVSALFMPEAKDRIGLIQEYIEPLLEG